MNKTDDLLLDVLAICNRHGIKSSQVTAVFGDIDFMTQVVEALETTENL